MKQLKIPYLPTLDVLDISSIGFLMEDKAHRESLDVVNWPDTYPYKPVVAFDIARGNEDLYIRFIVRGNSLKAVHSVDGSSVYEDSCVEFFMKKVNEPVYMNFEFNCIGVCDAARRLSREEKNSVSAGDYASIRRFSTVKSGPFFEEKMGIHAWELTVAIPFRTMDLEAANLPEKIQANFYKCADKTVNPHFVSWNPIDLPQPDFHCPAFFGELYF